MCMRDTRVAAYSIDYLLTSKGMWKGERTVMRRLILKFTCHVDGLNNNISSDAGDLLWTITSICEHVVDDVGQQLEEHEGEEGVCGRGASILGFYKF